MCCPWSVVLLLLCCWLVLFSMREQKPVPLRLYLPHPSCLFPPETPQTVLLVPLVPPYDCFMESTPDNIKLSGIKAMLWCFVSKKQKQLTSQYKTEKESTFLHLSSKISLVLFSVSFNSTDWFIDSDFTARSREQTNILFSHLKIRTWKLSASSPLLIWFI